MEMDDERLGYLNGLQKWMIKSLGIKWDYE
jgi:hypothetical protein